MSLEKTVVKWGREFLEIWVQRGVLPTFWGSSISQISGMLHPGLMERKNEKDKQELNKIKGNVKGFRNTILLTHIHPSTLSPRIHVRVGGVGKCPG